MKNILIFLTFCYFTTLTVFGQADTSFNNSTAKQNLNPYTVNQAFEVESLVPMFFTGGYHFGIGYRYESFRIRMSIINGGKYNAEPTGVNNSSSEFKRYYKTSPGVFVGYNVWKGLELYTYLELHTFAIEQKSSGIQKDLKSTDFGGGVSYQYFIGDYFYVQPGAHIYLRKEKGLNFETSNYNIPTTDLSVVLRLGIRLWSK